MILDCIPIYPTPFLSNQTCNKNFYTQAASRLFYWGAYADKFGGQVQETQLYGATVAIREPNGVIAIACPDEQPLLSFVSLFAPAIVRSNAVIIIPSEKNPLPALDFYQVKYLFYMVVINN